MAFQDDLQRLRRDLDEVVERTTEISRRLTALQRQFFYYRDEAEPAKGAESPPPIVTPPPYIPTPPMVEKPARLVPPPEYIPERPSERPSERAPMTPVKAEPAPEGVVAKFIRERLEELQAKRRELGWEVLVGTYGLPRIAVVCISIAVVFFLSLAIERWGSQWLPHLRVAIGYAVCAGLLVLAWRFEKKYAGLARVLYGGGFAVMYFVTYATYYISFARVFQSPVSTLIMLTAVVIGWAVAAQVRRSKVIAVLVTGLGHLTVLLSTLTLERPGPFAMVGLVFLGAGSAFFLLRNRWYYVGSLGVVGCYINDAVILAHSRGGNPVVDFWASMGVLAFFFLTFALAELLSHEKLRRDLVPTWFRSGLVTVNTAGLLLIGTFLVRHFEFTHEHQDLFRFASAAALLLIGLGYLRLRAGDPLFNVYFVKAVALATIALATRYGGSTLGVALAVETLVLLISARRSALAVTRGLAFAVALVALAYLAPQALLRAHVAYTHDAAYWGEVLKGAVAVLAFLSASQLYQRTDWAKRSPRTLPVPKDWLIVLWQLDLVSERPDGADSLEKPAGSLLLPYLYGLGGALIFICHTRALLESGHRLPALGAFALALAVAAYLLDSKPFGLISVLAAMAVAFPVGALEVVSSTVFSTYAAVGGLAALAAVALASEADQLGLRRGLDYHQSPVSPYILYGELALLTALALSAQLNPFNCTIAMAGAAVVAGALIFLLHPMSWAGICLGFLIWASVSCATGLGHEMEPRWRLVCWGLAALLIAGDRFFTRFKTRIRYGDAAAAVSVVLCMAVLWSYLHVETMPTWFVASMTLTCFAFCAYGMGVGSTAAFATGLAVALIVTGLHMKDAFDAVTLDTGMAVGFGLLALFWLAMERIAACYKRFDEQIRNALAAATPVLCMAVVWSYLRVEATPAWFVASMTLACFAFCAYGIGLRAAAAFVTGLVVALIMTAIHMQDAFRATTLDKGMVAGFVLLALFWLAIERILAWYVKRSGERIEKALSRLPIPASADQIACLPVILLTLVLLVMAYRVPHLIQTNRGYITLGWFAVAAGNFVLSLAFGRRDFRYAGLAVIVLSLLRLFLIDMKEQDPLLRVAAFGVVGAGLLSISIGYFKWMARVRAAKREQAGNEAEPQPKVND